MELIERLKDKYGSNEPITTEEILSEWSEYSRPRVFQLLKKAVECGDLCKFEVGIYYVPKQTILGKKATLSWQKVLEKKYIRSGDRIYGYYSGLMLLNQLRLTTQVPNSLEVVSVNASAPVRVVNIGGASVKIKKPRVYITEANVNTLMLLEVFNQVKYPLIGKELDGVREFVKATGITAKEVFRLSQAYPARAIKNLISSGVENVFAS